MTVPAESTSDQHRMAPSDGAAELASAPVSGGAPARRSDALLYLVQACLRERTRMLPADADGDMPGPC